MKQALISVLGGSTTSMCIRQHASALNPPRVLSAERRLVTRVRWAGEDVELFEQREEIL